jgi:hypothetical protein
MLSKNKNYILKFLFKNKMLFYILVFKRKEKFEVWFYAFFCSLYTTKNIKITKGFIYIYIYIYITENREF